MKHTCRQFGTKENENIIIVIAAVCPAGKPSGWGALRGNGFAGRTDSRLCGIFR